MRLEPMSHFGVLSYKGTGHLNPFIALSRQLLSRGHRVTFLQKPALKSHILQQGLEFVPIGELQVKRNGQQIPVQSGIAGLQYGMRRILSEIEVFLRDAPSVISEAGIDVLLVDEIALYGPTLAEVRKIPYFVISTSVPSQFGWTIPSWLSLSKPTTSPLDQLRTDTLQVTVFRIGGPLQAALDEFRRRVGLGPTRKIRRSFPELAHLSQLPECLDFPRSLLPSNFYYTGPLVDKSARSDVPFPWDRLDGRPLIYASLGTAKTDRLETFHCISDACSRLNLQLVMSLAGRHDPESFRDMHGEHVVVRFAPQLELIKRAIIVITHGGLNTALETLLEGKPMIVIPMAHDQPAVAARLSSSHVAEVLDPTALSADSLQFAIQKLLNDSTYRESARMQQVKIQATRGLERAADVIEDYLDRFRTNPSNIQRSQWHPTSLENSSALH